MRLLLFISCLFIILLACIVLVYSQIPLDRSQVKIIKVFDAQIGQLQLLNTMTATDIESTSIAWEKSEKLF